MRSELDSSASTVSYKKRDAEVRKIPYIALCGRRETKTGKIAIRKHGLSSVGCLAIEELTNIITEERSR